MDLSIANFREAISAALPTGRLWRMKPGGNFWKLKDGIAAVWQELHQDSEAMRLELDPRTAYLTLPEWEANYGLPDPDGPLALSVADRRAAVWAKKIAIGGQDIAYLRAQVEAMGYVGVEIDEFDVCTCEDTCESFLFGTPWLYALLFTLPVSPVGLGSTCDGSCEDYLGVPMNSHIENFINRIIPGHAVALFAYVGD